MSSSPCLSEIIFFFLFKSLQLNIYLQNIVFASHITEWILSGTKSLFPWKNNQQKLNNHLWFMPKCTAAIVHLNNNRISRTSCCRQRRRHHHHLYHKNLCSKDPCQTQNCPKSLEETFRKCNEQLYTISLSQDWEQRTSSEKSQRKFSKEANSQCFL